MSIECFKVYTKPKHFFYTCGFVRNCLDCWFVLFLLIGPLVALFRGWATIITEAEVCRKCSRVSVGSTAPMKTPGGAAERELVGLKDVGTCWKKRTVTFLKTGQY